MKDFVGGASKVGAVVLVGLAIVTASAGILSLFEVHEMSPTHVTTLHILAGGFYAICAYVLWTAEGEGT